MDITMEDFMSLIQEGTVQDYCYAFESLLNKVRVSQELSEDYVVYCFIMGLKPEISEVLKPHHNIDESLKLKDAIFRAEMQELILKLDSINWNQSRLTRFDDSSKTMEVSDSILQQEDNSMVILDVENDDDVKKYNNDKDRTVINQEKMSVVIQDQGIELVVPKVFDEMPSRFENEFDSLFQDCSIQDPCDGENLKEGENYKESTIRFYDELQESFSRGEVNASMGNNSKASEKVVVADHDVGDSLNDDLERVKLSSSKTIQESPLNTKLKNLGIQMVRKRKGVKSWLVRWKWKSKIEYLKLQTSKFVASLFDNVAQQEQAVNNLVRGHYIAAKRIVEFEDLIHKKYWKEYVSRTHCYCVIPSNKYQDLVWHKWKTKSCWQLFGKPCLNSLLGKETNGDDLRFMELTLWGLNCNWEAWSMKMTNCMKEKIKSSNVAEPHKSRYSVNGVALSYGLMQWDYRFKAIIMFFYVKRMISSFIWMIKWCQIIVSELIIFAHVLISLEAVGGVVQRNIDVLLLVHENKRSTGGFEAKLALMIGGSTFFCVDTWVLVTNANGSYNEAAVIWRCAALTNGNKFSMIVQVIVVLCCHW